MGEFDDYLKENGISHEVTTRYSPEENRKTKRVNCTIMRSIYLFSRREHRPY